VLGYYLYEDDYTVGPQDFFGHRRVRLRFRPTTPGSQLDYELTDALTTVGYRQTEEKKARARFNTVGFDGRSWATSSTSRAASRRGHAGIR
jgi:hypothetical protein